MKVKLDMSGFVGWNAYEGYVLPLPFICVGAGLVRIDQL